MRVNEIDDAVTDKADDVEPEWRLKTRDRETDNDEAGGGFQDEGMV